jgi:hypothetical protein
MAVHIDGVFSRVVALTKMRPRGNGFGVKGSAHTVRWPSYDDYKLGVLIGMTYGDGNLIKRATASCTGKWRVEFCEGDALLVMRYAQLTKQLFNVAPTVRNRITWHEAYYCCRIAYGFLTFVAEHPNGKKTGRLRIPKVVKLYPLTRLGFICGLFSVEGSVKDRRYPRLAIEMLEPKLLKSVGQQLEILGFKPHPYDYQKGKKKMFGLYIYGREECGRFLVDVGLFGKRARKLSRFLTPPKQAGIARKQPGGG